MSSTRWILLRGLAREQGHWQDFKSKLSASDPKAEVIGIDLPGAGEFHKLSSPMTISGIAEFVHSQIPKAKTGQNQILLSISLGAMVATELAALYPKEFSGLILINSSFKNFSSLFQRLQTEALMHMYQALTAANPVSRERAILDMVSNLPATEKDVIAQKWALISQARPVSGITFLKQLAAAATYEAPTKAPLENCLVLTSEADNMVNFRCSRTIAERWSVPIQIHPTSGHELTLDAPDWVIEQALKMFRQ